MKRDLLTKIEDAIERQKKSQSQEAILSLTQRDLAYIHIWIKTAYANEDALDEALGMMEKAKAIPKKSRHKVKIEKRIYQPLGDNFIQEESKYNGKECIIIKQSSPLEYIVKFDDGYKMSIANCELK